MAHADWVYLDGEILQRDAARVSPLDRGFLFAHAAYEVTAVYNGKLIDFSQHAKRLRRTLDGIEIKWEMPDAALESLHYELLERNGVSEGLVYMQVTAGNEGMRDFYGQESFEPFVFMFVTPKTLIAAQAQHGITAISVEDTRWKRRHMKTTQLLSQSLAYRAARRSGADTAIMHEDGYVTEAASANLWMVDQSGTIWTRDLSAALLPGITRASVLDLMRADGLDIREQAFSLQQVFTASEVFTTSTGVVIAPILSIDGQAVGNGVPGPVTRQVQRLYYRYIGADIAAYDWL